MLDMIIQRKVVTIKKQFYYYIKALYNTCCYDEQWKKYWKSIY